MIFEIFTTKRTKKNTINKLFSLKIIKLLNNLSSFKNKSYQSLRKSKLNKTVKFPNNLIDLDKNSKECMNYTFIFVVKNIVN